LIGCLDDPESRLSILSVFIRWPVTSVAIVPFLVYKKATTMPKMHFQDIILKLHAIINQHRKLAGF
jgi:hypothetical protein